MITIHQTNKRAKFGEVSRGVHLEDPLCFLRPRLKACGSETVSEPIGFFNTPFTLRGVDRVTMLFQSSEKLVKGFNV